MHGRKWLYDALSQSLGYRYRLNRRERPGILDLDLTRHQCFLFVYGCC
ncbi:MAG: hypothetical protein C4548_02665 [Desulfobacteraceae bacterium]|nr:MAG: hypothetical protein C4548_02665 [Desulfobacteraceae bacterium]